MNVSNSTLKNGDFVPDAETILIINIIFYIDTVIRISSALIHIFYFSLLIFIAKLRKRTLLFVHHTNLIGFLFNLHYLYFFNYIHPNYNDPNLNKVLCVISEVAWALLKTLRTYSIGLIAVYRLIAVFKPALFKKINKSLWYLIGSILSIYLICIIIYLVPKYVLNTTYGYLYCFDGFSKNKNDSLYYFFVQSILGIILPVVFTIIAYIIIVIRLKNNKKQIHSDDMNTEAIRKNLKENFRQRQQANQMYLINICELVSSIMVVGLGLRYTIPNLNEYYNIPRFLLRTINILFQTFIPLMTMAYNPSVSKKFKKAKILIFKKYNYNLDDSNKRPLNRTL